MCNLLFCLRSTNSSQPLFVCLFVCLAFGSQYTVCLACFLVSRQSKCLKIEELQRYFLTASAHLTTLKKSHFYCYGQCTQHPRQRGEEQAVSVSSPLRVMWVILQKGHYQLCPAVCIILLTSLVFVHLFLPSPLSFIFFSVLSISCCPFSLCSQPC